MQNIIQSITDFFTPKPVSIIEAVNDCGEKRYIEIPRPVIGPRRENLNILFTKCKKLLSFVTIHNYDDIVRTKITNLSANIRVAMYRNDDITYLFEEYESVERLFFKKSSKSSMNLSSLEHM
jgi:hypothetical protein